MKTKLNLLLVGLLIIGFSSCSKNVNTDNAFHQGTPEDGLSLLKFLQKNLTPSAVDVNKVSKYFGGKDDKHFRSFDNINQLCAVDETDFEVIRRQVIYPFQEGVRVKKAFDFNKIVKNGSSKIVNIDGLLSPHARSKREGVYEYSWLKLNDLEGVVKGQESFNNYLAQFDKIDDFQLASVKFISPSKYRSKKDLRMERAKIVTRFDLRGTHKKMRRNDRGVFTFDVVKTASGWKLHELNVIQGETLTKAKPTFREITSTAIGDQVPTYLRQEAIRRGGYAISVSDFDNDGNNDLYVGTMGNGVLLRGDTEGNFRKINGLGPENNKLVKTAIFGDFFNTGKQDLVLVRFVPNHLKLTKADANNDEYSFSDVIFYENKGNGEFKKVENLIENRNMSGNAMPAAVADFNGDDKLDFYIGFPGPLDFTFVGGNSGIQQGAQVQGLYINDGKRKKFIDRTQENIKYTENEFLFAHSSMSADLDMDGDMDLIVLDDRGNLSPVYLNDGTGKFTESAKKTGITNSDLSMGVAGGDIDNDGVLDFAVSNVNFVASERWSQSCAQNWRSEFKDYAREGLKLFKGAGKGKFIETTEVAGLDWVGEGVAGVEFIDYNNDGNLDIYVATGLWSGTDRTQDISSLFIKALQAEKYYFNVEMTEEGTASDFMKVLNSFVGDIYNPEKKQDKVMKPHMAGFQRNRLFRNDGNGKFTEVGYLEGIDSIADGYVMSKTDINKDGKMDLILRNGDPGVKEVAFKPVQVFLNESPEKSNSLIVKLKGKKSNRDAVGSFVRAKVGNEKYVRHLIANNGTAQSEKILHFGLGKANQVDRLEVTWPNGNRQVLTNVPAGKIVIEEKVGNGKFANN